MCNQGISLSPAQLGKATAQKLGVAKIGSFPIPWIHNGPGFPAMIPKAAQLKTRQRGTALHSGNHPRTLCVRPPENTPVPDGKM